MRADVRADVTYPHPQTGGTPYTDHRPTPGSARPRHAQPETERWLAQPGPAGWQPPQPEPAGWSGQPGGVRHEPTVRERAAAELRADVARRLTFMNDNHARHAWDLRRRDPLSAHGLALCYAEPVAGIGYTLRVATRLVAGNDEWPRLPMLLRELVGVATRRGGEDGFDPRTHMATRCEATSAHAFYVGVGVSSLDTPAGEWDDVVDRVTGPSEIPGRCYAVLADTTLIQVDRLADDDLGVVNVRATSLPNGLAYGWTRDPYLADPARLADAAGAAGLTVRQRDDLAATWHWLTQLHHQLLLTCGDTP
jgi:hypothetical protein